MALSKPRDSSRGRRAKIICTLGPSTDDDAVLDSLLEKGMDAVRLNFSFGAVSEHLERIRKLRALVGPRRRPFAIIADIPGRKVRIGKLEGHSARLETDTTVRFVRDEGHNGNAGALPVDAGLFHENMARGDRLLLADGIVEVEIVEFSNDALDARVVYGGVVAERTAVHVPGLKLTGGALKPSDICLLETAIRAEVDYVAVGYVGDAADILQVREKLIDLGKDIPIIAKIERPEAFSRLDGILRRAAAVMIRRGDLGAEIEFARIPLVQKKILLLANRVGVPVIIATQMLGSMIHSPRPTRAEASDVSNAVVDGADGLLLSAETAIGQYPVESVAMMNRIIAAAESERLESTARNLGDAYDESFTDATAGIAHEAAQRANARMIACFTESGRTAQLVAKYRPSVPIVAFCAKEEVRRRLALHWGVRSDLLGVGPEVESMIRRVETRLLDTGLVGAGDRIVVVFGAPLGIAGQTNSVRLHEVGSGSCPIVLQK